MDRAAFSHRLTTTLQDMYDRAATSRQGLLSPVPVSRGGELLRQLGYPEELIRQIPEKLQDCAFPCANPLPRITEFEPESLLDLGCGAGLDLLFAARTCPQLDRLAGIENSTGLRDQAKKLLGRFPEEKKRITLHAGDFNRLQRISPAPADLILMNGSFNLVYDKPAFLRQAKDALNPEGTLLIYDFLLTEALPEGFSREPDNWLWNIGGALPPADLDRIAGSIGLQVETIRKLERIDPVVRCEIVIKR
ncbi:MAG: class I SAM-dependent methyltransferase [Deltaproteobacteria bacterium]|nr:class I SAM-dependent methyltransferase [Deltaproteobacteria bacterium]